MPLRRERFAVENRQRLNGRPRGTYNGDFMSSTFSRRATLAAGASALALGALPTAFAQSRTKLRFSSAFTEQDLRTEAYKNLAASIKDGYDFEPYWGNTLFKQGAELVA